MSAAATHLLPLRTHERFEFLAEAPLDVAWPLFGAEGERAWAPGWQPRFIWPPRAADEEGMVFTVSDGERTAVWVNTVFDRDARRIQYVSVIPDLVATVISLRLTQTGQSTHIAVMYERTALLESANETVSLMAARDALAGPEWGRQINDYLRGAGTASNQH